MGEIVAGVVAGYDLMATPSPSFPPFVFPGINFSFG
jgi:hypothetical protein